MFYYVSVQSLGVTTYHGNNTQTLLFMSLFFLPFDGQVLGVYLFGFMLFGVCSLIWIWKLYFFTHFRKQKRFFTIILDLLVYLFVNFNIVNVKYDEDSDL